MIHQKLKQQWSSVPRVFRWSIVDAALGCACATLFGIVFAGFGAAIHGEIGRIITIVAYCALCGTIAGGVLGTFGALIDVAEPRQSAGTGSDSSGDSTDVVIRRTEAPFCSNERSNEIPLVSRFCQDHQEQLDLRASRIPDVPLPRAREAYRASKMRQSIN